MTEPFYEWYMVIYIEREVATQSLMFYAISANYLVYLLLIPPTFLTILSYTGPIPCFSSCSHGERKCPKDVFRLFSTTA